MAKKSDKGKITAKVIQGLLHDRFNDPRRYISAKEVALTTGGATRRIDFCVMTCYQSESFALEGIEIKVDPADLRHELQEHMKHEVFFNCFDYYSIAVSDAAYTPNKDDIPKGWGIYVVKETTASKKARKQAREAGEEEPDPVFSMQCRKKPMPIEGRSLDLPRGFVASFARKCVSDAVAPLMQENSTIYQRGYNNGVKAGKHQGNVDLEIEVERLRYVEGLRDRIANEKGFLHEVSIEKSLDMIKAMDISNLVMIYDTLARLHEVTKSAIAALSGKYDLDEWMNGTADGSDLTDEEVDSMIEEHDEMMHKAHRRAYGD